MSKQRIFKTDFDSYMPAATPLGSGGSGIVYKVIAASGGDYALKVLDSSRASSSKVKRFANELNFGRRNRHDNVVAVIDSGVTEDGTERMPFFVMPLYSQSYRKLIGKQQADDALRLFLDVLAGVECAHAKKVVHRDLKPENILYDESADRLLIADFGVAHFEEDELLTAVETKDGDRLANFIYAAPEQRERGAPVDHRADIYALGLMLHEAFTGVVPLGTGYQTIARVSPRHAYVDQVVGRMISHSASDRYESVAAVRDDLRLLGAGVGLPKAREVAATVTAASRKRELFKTVGGVSLVREGVTTVYQHVVDVLRSVASESPSLKLQFEAKVRKLSYGP